MVFLGFALRAVFIQKKETLSAKDTTTTELVR